MAVMDRSVVLTRRPARAWRALRVVARVTRLNFAARLEYRGDFVLWIVSGMIWQSSVMVFATVLVNRFPALAGWTRGDVLLIAGMRLLSHGLYVLVFGNIAMVSIQVQEGRIEGYMLRPMPVYRQVMLHQFAANAIGDLSIATVLFGLAVARADVAWTAPHVLYLVAAVVGGMLLEAAVQTVIGCFALRTPGTTPWGSWLDELMSTFGNYPLRILPGVAQSALTFVLPLAFVAYLPAAVLTGHTVGLPVPWVVAACSPLVGLLVFVLARYLWNRSLRSYVGVGG
jgi:ABC-2 type transport system permease protein